MEEAVILVCEDSLEGIFTGVYEAYATAKRRNIPLEQIELQTGGEGDLRLFVTYEDITPDPDKAQKVVRTLRSRFGEEDYYSICLALSAPDNRKAQAVFQTINWGLSDNCKGSVLAHLADDAVRIVMELGRGAGREYSHLQGFLRFQEMDCGVLYSVISPKNDILAGLAAHFADRLPREHFIILDEGRNLYAFHAAGKEPFLMKGQAAEEVIPQDAMQVSAEEVYYQELFRHFCHKIAIEDRINLNLQLNMLPLHFRKYMVEFAK